MRSKKMRKNEKVNTVKLFKFLCLGDVLRHKQHSPNDTLTFSPTLNR